MIDDSNDRRIDGAILHAGGHPGCISTSFHLGADGSRVLRYAEWTDADAHIEAIGDPAWAKWHGVQIFHGMVDVSIKRYRPGRNVTRPDAGMR